MGDISDDGHKSERPVHLVRIIRPFAIGRYEVTFEEYDLFAAVTGRELPDDREWFVDKRWGRGQRPVINVSLGDAADYTNWLSEQTSKRYRLPTEAEWEYAARSGGQDERWAGTSCEQELREYAWYAANSGGKTEPVGTKKPNGLGLYDMSGNVFELVQDRWHDNYEGAPADGRAWLQGGIVGQHVIRGGAYSSDSGPIRSAFRSMFGTAGGFYTIGFRLARELD